MRHFVTSPRFLIPLCCAAVLIALSASGCRRAPPPLPTGPQTVTGTLQRAELSLRRRGTHLLRVGEKNQFYLESRTIDLYPLEGREVTLEGILERNTDPADTPVLVVLRVAKGAAEPLRTWTARPLGLSLDVPRSWQAEMPGKTTALFTQSGSTRVLLHLSLQPRAELPFDFQSLTASGRAVTLTPLVFGSRKAVAVSDSAASEWTVYVDAGPDRKPPSVVTLAFTLDAAQESGPQIVSAEKIARTLIFLGAEAASRASPVSTGSGALGDGKPCGGPAGVLCPAGFYCQITDVVEDIGKCRKL